MKALRNQEAKSILVDAHSELDVVVQKINFLRTNGVTSFLDKYAVIRACGALEQAFKVILIENCSKDAIPQISNFLESRFRSINPSYENMKGALRSFDSNWASEFKRKINSDPNNTRIILSLKSLVDARNAFAHGGDTNASAQSAQTYLVFSAKALEILEDITTN